MIVHQIFWDFYGQGMNDLFSNSNKKFIAWCKDNGYEYKLWGEFDCHALVKEYPEFLSMYANARYQIMQIDIVRLLILHKYGGLYCDLDVFPNMESVKDTGLRFVEDKTNSNRKSGKKITNEILQMPKGHQFPLDFLHYVQFQIHEKENIEVYNTWKMRYVLQTTGPYALTRFLKTYKYPYKFYTTNQLLFEEKGKWKYVGLGDTSNVDFITHNSVSWAEAN